MSGDAKYISLYYSLVHQGASDFYKEIIKGPGGNMSYLPPWAPSSGGGHYPPHMLPSSHSAPSSSSSSSSSSTAGGGGGSLAAHTTHNTTGLNTPSVYQTLSPVVKSSSPTSVSVTQSINTPKTSTLPTSGAGASSTSTSSSAQSSGTTMSLGDPYEPQGFQRPHTPPLKRTPAIAIGEGTKTESPTMGDGAPPPEMLLALAGPSSMDLKTPRNSFLAFRAPAKHPAPEQLPSPVMFSYQGRGRPRKNWTHATGLPTMIPVTHPSMHCGTTEDPDDEENKPFKCNLCGKGFKLKGGLVQHERTHSTDRPYVCPECGKLFRQPTHLQQHIRIHTGDKPYDCAFCGKSFRQRTILNQHLRIHTGEKPYVCMECGKQFRQKAILDQHFRTHLGEKPYACPHPSCRKHFREMAALISHMKCHKDVPDPRIVLQQAKRIKEERHDDLRLDPQILGEHGEGTDRGGLLQDRLGQEVMGLGRIGLDRGLGQDRGLIQERGLGQERAGPAQDRAGLGQERGGLGQEVMSPERSHGHEHSEGSSTGSEQSYQGNGEQVQHEQARGFPQHNVNSSSAQKSPHSSLPQHSSADRQSQPSPSSSQSLTSPLPPNMMPTPQMAMANLIPYPHSIFPATSYMMPPPDPRQYHPQSQGQHPSRPNQ
ncbi:zinc finger protein 768-like isoform X3 [Eriocheir sinensis]|uniref:zinc finger protein 768-like isoform X3 n=1 Tax=Eriocheir sinensis TaxID=95602 RepID=UPI0021C83865|nr:zinc finger protein 768-like isoform X3 [Eriocheir sinensis]